MKANIPKTGRWRIRVHDFDAWSAYYTIAKIISPVLKRFKKDTRSIPGSLVPYDENLSEEEDRERFREGCRKWDEILEKIIWAMDELGKNERNAPDFPRLPGLTRRESDKRMFNREKNKEEMEIHKEFREKTLEYDRKIQEGCELLGKYFRDLWS